MSEQGIRWKQRLNNYNKALSKLAQAVEKIVNEYHIEQDTTISKDDFLDDIIKEGLIQRFEYTHELAWNVMKDFLISAGNTGIYGSKDATREAFNSGLIVNGEVWMDMISSRNKTSHTYNEAIADEIFLKIISQYLDAFQQFHEKMEGIDKRGK